MTLLFGLDAWGLASCGSAFASSALLVYKYVKDSQPRDRLLLGLAFLSVAIADIIYAQSYSNTNHEISYMFKIGEMLYLIFIVLLICFLFYRYRKFLFNLKSEKILFLGLAFGYGAINYIYILHPFYTRDPSPDLFNAVASLLYSAACALLLPFLIIQSLRINNFFQNILLQAFLLLNIVDFAIRYKTAFLNTGISIYFDQAWFCCIIFSAWFAIIFQKQVFDDAL